MTSLENMSPLRSVLLERLCAPGNEFLTMIDKKFIARLNTKEISRLAAYLDGKGWLYSKNSYLPAASSEK